MIRNMVRVILAAAIALLVLAAASFVCGVVMGLIDRGQADSQPSLMACGLAGAAFGTIIFGLPVVLATGVARWLLDRSRDY